jgi:hypothetical protein
MFSTSLLLLPDYFEMDVVFLVEVDATLHRLVASQWTENLDAFSARLNFIREGFILVYTEVAGVYDLLPKLRVVFLANG